MEPNDSTTIRVGDFLVDRLGQRLWQQGRSIDLVPQVWTLLSLLLERAGQLVTKEEILQVAWRGIAVSDAALSQAVRRLRSAFGDDARNPRYVETVHRRGFRLIAKVRSAATEPVPAAPAQDDTSLFVGREAESETLLRILAAAHRGARRVVFVEGEAGIGKTSLLRSFQARIAGPNVQVAAAQCVQKHGSSEPYSPLLEALDRLVKASPETLQVLRRHAPTWLVQMPWLLRRDEVRGLESAITDATRARMLREMARAFDVMSAEQTVVLILEDLHWADEATLDLLAAIARRPDTARLMVLASYRPAEAIAFDHPIVSLCRSLWSGNACARLSLTYFDRRDTHLYLAQRFSSPSVDALADRIHQRCEGHPLFLAAIVDHLVARGVIIADRGEWKLARPVGDEDLRNIPSSLREMLELQLSTLDDDELELLRAASVAAVEFRAASVAAALGSAPADMDIVEGDCERLIERRHLLRAVGEELWPDGTRTMTYAFRHQLYRQALYEGLPTSRKRRFHQRIGERLEQAFQGELSRVAAEIGAHFECGGDGAKAASYLALAARQAHRRFADREAAHQLRGALANLERASNGVDGAVFEMQIRMGIVLAHWLAELARPEEDDEHVERIGEIAATLDIDARSFTLCHRLWTIYTFRSAPVLAAPSAEDMVALANKGEAALRAPRQMEALLARGVTALMRGEVADGTSSLTAALELYGDGDPPACASFPGYEAGWEGTGARVHGFVGMAFFFSGALDRAADHLSRAIDCCAGRVHPKHAASAYLAMAGFLCLLGEVEGAQAWSDRGCAVAQEHGFASLITAADAQRLWLGIRRGAQEGSRDAIETAVRSYLKRRAMNPAPAGPLLLADVCRMARMPDAGLTLVNRVWEETRGTQLHWWDVELRRLQGELLLLRGKADARARAEACFREAIAIAQRQGARLYELRAATSLARLAKRGRKGEQARNTLGRVYAMFTEGFGTDDVRAAQELLHGRA